MNIVDNVSIESSLMICRFCVQPQLEITEIIKLYTDYRFGDIVANILLKYLPFEITENDNESDVICLKCWTKFKEFHEFITFIWSCQVKNLKLQKIKYEINENSQQQNDAVVKMENEVSNGNLEIDSIERQASYDDDPVEKYYDQHDWYDDDKSNKESTLINVKKQRHQKMIKKKLKTKCENEKIKRIANRQIENEKIRNFFQLSCRICIDNNAVGFSNDNSFETIQLLRTHYRQVHKNNRGYIICCSKKLTHHWELIEHMEWHTNPDKFKCPTCHKVYSDQIGLKVHMYLHAPDEEKIFICDICGKSYSHRHHLLKHFRLTHFSEKNFKCQKCEKAFGLNSVLRAHIRNVHENSNVHMCDICAKLFRSKYQCQQHRIQQHEPESERPAKLECFKCGALLKSKSSLKMHIARTHDGEQQKCPICDHSYSNAPALKKHIKYVHEDEPIHKCTLCEKSFKRIIGLKEHMASHSGDVSLYTCTYCPKTFNSNSNKHSHRKKVHPVEWLRDRKTNKGRLPNI